ncbi:hypothetical protein [Pontibacter kalidii]|uniref:hypothetical protein n=1 Tax=Pontibacter kalidii TaxID=2592049 RepID=UPI0022590726|nr:hypothetical protein [Pontibacter kalidii]
MALTGTEKPYPVLVGLFLITALSSEKLKEKIPPFLAAVLPIVIPIIIILIGSFLEIEYIILIGLAAAIVVSAIAFRK